MSRVLVVDDDRAILEMVTWALADEGYTVLSAAHGAEALDVVRREPPSVILLDMTMPVMDGWEFSRQLRALYDRKIPIICMTAARDARSRSDDIGAEGLLAKPFDLVDLYRCVERFADAARG